MLDSVMFQFLTAVNFIAIFALVGVGLAVTLGMMGVINLAHGEFMMLGAYAAWLFLFVIPNFWVCTVLAAIMVALLSLIVERTLIRTLYNRPMETILATFGLGIILQELVQLVFGKKDKVIEAPFTGYVDFLGTVFSSYRLVVIGASILILTGVVFFFLKTNYGLKARAIMANKEMASALGINTTRVNQLIFAIGAGLAGLAGALIAPIVATRPTLGADYIIDAFFVVVLGGVGSIWGPIAGAAAIGGSKGFVEYFLNIVGARMIVLVICIVIIRIKPKGIFAPR